MNDYKSEKVSFVSGTTGSSLYHVNSISLVALVSVALYASLTTRLPNQYRGFIAQWVLLVFPLLLSMTLFANAPLALSTSLALPTAALLLWLPHRDVSSPLPSKRPPSNPRPIRFPPIPSLTVYRAHMMLMTILAILAVDFPVFPRSLAKCETFGLSLMDLGVGSFVFSQGLVSAIPFVSHPDYLLEPTLNKLKKTIRKSVPVLALGLIRVLLVKGTDYPEHVTEYGVHWNFFLTLAFVPILQVILHPLLSKYPISLIGLSIAFLQQFLLSKFGLQSIILSTPRTNILTANKEGLISLLGYLSIHLFGLSAGTIILPHSPSYFRRYQHDLAVYKRTTTRNNKAEQPPSPSPAAAETVYRQTGKTAAELFSYSSIWWILLGVVRVLEVGGKWGNDESGGGVSRRMANLPYILWVAAFNLSFFLGYFTLLDIFFFPQRTLHTKKEIKKSKSKNTGGGVAQLTPTAHDPVDNTPSLFTALNKHGLTVFLLANVLTGCINLTIPTMHTPDSWAMGVLSVYSILVCWIAWKLEQRNRTSLASYRT